MNLRTLFHIGPTKAQQLVDLWHKDRQAALKASDSMPFRDIEPMLDLENMQQRFDQAVERENFRTERLRTDVEREMCLKSSRFTVLRNRRGLPFKSRRQPV